MPLQQRIPKFGFSSRVNRGTKEVNLKNIASMSEVNLETLKANRVISQATKKVKIFGVCDIAQPMSVTGILVTKGAMAPLVTSIPVTLIGLSLIHI